MNYNDEIIRFFIITPSGWDVTGYHSRSLYIIKNRHNLGHNLHAGFFEWPTIMNMMWSILFPSGLRTIESDKSAENARRAIWHILQFLIGFKLNMKHRNSYKERKCAPNIRFFFNNSKNMGKILSESIDLVITSPPYPMIKMWDGVCHQKKTQSWAQFVKFWYQPVFWISKCNLTPQEITMNCELIAVISIRHAMWVSKSHLIYVFYLCREFFENRSDCKSVWWYLILLE